MLLRGNWIAAEHMWFKTYASSYLSPPFAMRLGKEVNNNQFTNRLISITLSRIEAIVCTIHDFNPSLVCELKLVIGFKLSHIW